VVAGGEGVEGGVDDEEARSSGVS